MTPGLDFFDTGVALVTDKPVSGVESIDTAEAEKICWGDRRSGPRPSGPAPAGLQRASRSTRSPISASTYGKEAS